MNFAGNIERTESPVTPLNYSPSQQNLTLNAAAKQRLLTHRGEPLFHGDWMRVLMIHFALEPRELQPYVPYKLHCFEGRAFVTLVAFTLENLHPCWSGPWTAWLCRPISNHHFLNVRTYVTHCGEPGIHFLAEWLSNWLAVQLGPRTFGLPYRWGKLQYTHHDDALHYSGSIRDCKTGATLTYEASANENSFAPCNAASLDEWLMERYTAFNAMGSRRRFFRVWHPPWPQKSAQVRVNHRELLLTNWPCFADAEVIGANYSPGLRNVWMGRPHQLK